MLGNAQERRHTIERALSDSEVLLHSPSTLSRIAALGKRSYIGRTSEAWRNASMSDVLAGVRDHYSANGLTERLKSALTVLGSEDRLLMPLQLAAVDHFHTRGLAATAE